MAKALNREEIIEEIGGYLPLWLKQGLLNAKIAECIFKGISVEDSDKLIKIHFLLQPQLEEDRPSVIGFVKKLPEWIRSIKTTNKQELLNERGEVRGRIDWNQTIKSRSMEHSMDNSIFICSSPTKQYDIDENLVLKKLLFFIYEILSFKEWEDAIDEGYDWIREWLKEDLDDGINLITQLREIFERNVHIRRIKDAIEYDVSDKMINKALCSRSELYRKAGKLLLIHNDLMDNGLTHPQITEVLNQIRPEDSVLFELYCIFKLIEQLRSGSKDLELKLIFKGDTHIASLWDKAKTELRIFHNSIGDLEFDIKRKEVESSQASGSMERKQKIILKANDMHFNLDELDEKEKPNSLVYEGRPDIIVEKFKDGEIEKVLIGEVKYTEIKETALKGIKELLEYIYTAKYKNHYFKQEAGENDKVSGFLLVNGWPFKASPQKPFPEKDESLAILDSQTIKTFNFLHEFKLNQ